MTLLCLAVTGTWADAKTIGLTQDYSKNTSPDGDKTWTTLTETTDHLTLTQQIGSDITNYGKTDKGNAIEDGTTLSTGTGCWRTGNPGTSYDNQHVGYDLTISSGYMINITGFAAKALSISNATLTWKMQILSSTDDVLYESGEKTMTNSSTPNVNVTVSNLDADKQVKLQNISGSLKVRLLIKGGKTKYFGIKTLTITADVIEDVRETHTITANVTDGQTSFGTIDNTGANDVVDGGAIALTAIANEGYGFVGWTKASDSSWTSTDNPLSLNNVTSDETYTAIFKKLYTVTYNMDGYILTNNKALNNYDASKSINEKYAGADDKYTIPAYSHYYMYRPGYIFSNKWEDQDGNQYDKGSEITLTKDITLTPVWTATTQTLDNSV